MPKRLPSTRRCRHVKRCFLLVALVSLSTVRRTHLSLPLASALEASWTPNPADSVDAGGDGGPLPLSMEQRKQLLELEQAIVSSPDPSATLSHIADQNQMSPEELGGMLDRNRRDLEGTGELDQMMSTLTPPSPGGGSLVAATGGTLPRRILSLAAAIVTTGARATSHQFAKHPKQSTAVVACATIALLAAHSAPRNGIVMSTGAGKPPLLLMSRGHTTLVSPPMDYVQNHYARRWETRGWVSSLPSPVEVELGAGGKKAAKGSKKKKGTTKRLVGGVGMTRSLDSFIAGANEEGVTMEKEVAKREGCALIVAARTSISIDEFMDSDDEEDEDETEEQRVLIYDSILAVLDDRKFSDYVSGKSEKALQFRSFLVADGDDDDDAAVEGAAMVMKSLGDFGRYGVQPLRLSYEHDAGEEGGHSSTTIRCVAFHTLKGGHFDGEVRFSLEQRASKRGDEGIIVSVALAIPKGGRSLPKKLAKTIVSSLAESIAESSRMRTKQTLSRRRQSRAYRARAEGSAATKRRLRYEQTKNQEEMAVERKRKWKRNNPDAGHYRPSGDMMKGPNSAGPRHGF